MSMETELAAFSQQMKDFARRLDEMENLTNSIHELTTSIKLLASKQETMEEKVNGINTTVTELSGRPAKWWDILIGALIGAAAGGIITMIVSQFKTPV